MLNNRIYDVLKWVAIIALPAIATLVATVGPLWGMPNCEAWQATINAVGTCLGALLMISDVNYRRGKDDGDGGCK